jgi:uncharacterized protein (DUF433 family)
MQLEDYFDFLAPDDIRIKGHRIGIETVLYDFVHRGRTPEQIVASYPSLTLEEVHATILYYLHDPKTVGQYLATWIEHGNRSRAEQQRNPTPSMLKLRQIRAERVLAEQRAKYDTSQS